MGLVNAYLKFCIRKGYVKVKRIPARRYSYLLTPKGFAEKSRLTIMHLSNSLAFFRQARTDCDAVFVEAINLGLRLVVLVGTSEVAEISTLCALESGVTLVGIVDAAHRGGLFMGLPVLATLDDVAEIFTTVSSSLQSNPPPTRIPMSSRVYGGATKFSFRPFWALRLLPAKQDAGDGIIDFVGNAFGHRREKLAGKVGERNLFHPKVR